jgi:hypothetical protein
MPVIPPEILPMFDDLGIVDAAECQWRRLPPHPAALRRSVCFCDSHPAPVQCELALTRLGGRRIYIGQCRLCLTVFVRDAVVEVPLPT